MKNKLILVVIWIVFALGLTGCGVSGTYVSKIDDNKSYKFQKSNAYEFWDGDFVYKNQDETTFGVYSIEEIPIGTGILMYDVDGNAVSSLVIYKDGLHDLQTNEIFVKFGFFKSMWKNHKFGIIVAFIILSVIGTIQEKIDKKTEKKEE